MGGGEGSEMESKVMVCQMCDQQGHGGPDCSWVYSRCNIDGCDGIRMLLISKTEKNPNRKFLKCSNNVCNNWKWLDEAVLDASGQGSSSRRGCFHCGEEGHFKVQCPWMHYQCTNQACKGTMVLRTSNVPHSRGLKFFKCHICGSFKWLKDVVKEKKKSEVSINLNVSLDDFCKHFATNVSVTKK